MPEQWREEHRKACEGAVARFQAKHPDLKKYEKKIVELGNAIHPEPDEDPEAFLDRLYHIAKTDELKLQMEAQSYEAKLFKKIEEMKSQYEEKLKYLEVNKAKDQALLAEIEKIKKIEPLQGPLVDAEFFGTSNAEFFGTTTTVAYDGQLPLVVPPQAPPDPPPKKEVPEVEPQRPRMIKLKK
jgi:hypothetical protein